MLKISNPFYDVTKQQRPKTVLFNYSVIEALSCYFTEMQSEIQQHSGFPTRFCQLRSFPSLMLKVPSSSSRRQETEARACDNPRVCRDASPALHVLRFSRVVVYFAPSLRRRRRGCLTSLVLLIEKKKKPTNKPFDQLDRFESFIHVTNG